MFEITAKAAGEAAQTATTNPLAAYSSLLPIILLFVIMWFFIIRPQNKKAKQEAKMRDSVEIGDDVVTIGGVVGKICKIKDDEVTIETGADRVKITFKKSAIGSVTKKEQA